MNGCTQAPHKRTKCSSESRQLGKDASASGGASLTFRTNPWRSGGEIVREVAHARVPSGATPRDPSPGVRVGTRAGGDCPRRAARPGVRGSLAVPPGGRRVPLAVRQRHGACCGRDTAVAARRGPEYGSTVPGTAYHNGDPLALGQEVRQPTVRGRRTRRGGAAGARLQAGGLVRRIHHA